MKPEVWPYSVGVRHYIPPKRKQQTWQDQSAQLGGLINPPQQPAPRGQGYQGGGNGYSGATQGYRQHPSYQHLQPQVPVQHGYQGQQPGQVRRQAHGYLGQQLEQVHGYNGQPGQSYNQQFTQPRVQPVGQQYGVITQNRFAVEGFAGSNYSN